MSSPNARAKSRGSLFAPGIRTSPRTNRNPYATNRPLTRKQSNAPAVTSGGTTAVARGGMTPEDNVRVAPPPARALSFISPQTEFANHDSVSSLSLSTKTHSTAKTSLGKHNLPNLSSEPKKKTKDAKVDCGEDDGDISIHEGNQEKDIIEDFIPITNKAMDNDFQGMEDDISHGIKMRHRKAFMAKAFPDLGDKYQGNAQSQSASIKSCRPQSEVDYIIHVLNNWEKGIEVNRMAPGPDRDNLIHFRRQHRAGNKYIHQYVTEDIWAPGDEYPRTILRKNNKDGTPGRIVVSREHLFDAIDEWHEHSGHLGQERTWKYCKSKYANVTQDHVKFYCQTCFTCMKKNPVTRNEKGSRKPIFSRNFRDRFQIDLIDFRKLRKRDPFGVLMRWVMTLKDHATGLTHICALPRKRPMLIAYKLQEIFGLLGYPKIFHTDNGKEFTASLILEFLRQLNPNILAVTGRPRRPRDQGSVENVNALVKRVLGSVLTERRLAGQNPNWTEVLGSVAAVLNSQSGRGRNDVSAYEAVFGCVYDHQFVCSKEEARRCWTIEDRMKVTNEPDFEEYVQQFYHVSRAADDDNEKTLVVDEDSGYFSEEEIAGEDSEEVTDKYFHAHLFDNTEQGKTEDLKRPPEELARETASDYYQDDENQEDYGYATDEYPVGDIFEETKITVPKLPPVTDSLKGAECSTSTDINKSNDEDYCEIVRYDKTDFKPTTAMRLLSMEDGWKWVHKYSKKKNDTSTMWCRICCDICSPGDIGGFGVKVLDERMIHRYANTQDWYDQGWVQGLIALAQHDVHIDPPRFKPSDKNILMVMVPSPGAIVLEEDIHDIGAATHFVSPVYDNNHFAVLYYDLNKCSVTVYDGLNMDITKWQKHIVHTLKKYGLKPLDSQCKSYVNSSKRTDRNNKDKITRVMELSFQSKLRPEQDWPDWTIQNDPDIEQNDGFNCGPIACLKVMEIFGVIEPGSMPTIAMSREGIRPVVMDYYQQLIVKYEKDLFFATRKNSAKLKATDLKTPKEKERTTAIVPKPEVVAFKEEVDDHTTVTRSRALEKKNKKQAYSAEKEIKRCGEAAICNGAAPGAVVTLKVDYRTHSHAQGLIGIVFDVKPTGGIKVCCDHGIITHSGGKGVYWVPVDKYVVKARPDEYIPLPDELDMVRTLVLEGRFQKNHVPTISYAKLHEIYISAASPVKKAPGCKCKNGKCGKSCGCRRKKMSCHSGCLCNGNCNE